MLAIGRIRFWASSLPPDRCSLPQALPLQFPSGVCFFGGGEVIVNQELPSTCLLRPQIPGPRAASSGLVRRPSTLCGWLVTHPGRSGPEGPSGLRC